MREIEFRGKRLPDKPGYEFYPGDKIWVCGYVVAGKKTIIITNEDPRFHYKVDPETAGQYTGLKDRNGVKIFEGDVVEWKLMSGETVKGTVEYAKSGFFIMPRWTALHVVHNICVVIGNIHDSPELLNGKEARNEKH